MARGWLKLKVPGSLHLAATFSLPQWRHQSAFSTGFPLMHMLKHHTESAAIHPRVALMDQVCNRSVTFWSTSLGLTLSTLKEVIARALGKQKGCEPANLCLEWKDPL